jgi:hypothetical protein
MQEAFEIIYADGSMVEGTTVADFRAAPNPGIQFVIVRYEDGRIIKHKCLSTYEYQGATKFGDWMDNKDFDKLKQQLSTISKLMFGADAGLTRRQIRQQRQRS